MSFTRLVPNLNQTRCKFYFILLLMCLFKFQLGFFLFSVFALSVPILLWNYLKVVSDNIVSVIHSYCIPLSSGHERSTYRTTQGYYDLDINFIKHQGSKNNVKRKGEFILPLAHLPRRSEKHGICKIGGRGGGGGANKVYWGGGTNGEWAVSGVQILSLSKQGLLQNLSCEDEFYLNKNEKQERM